MSDATLTNEQIQAWLDRASKATPNVPADYVRGAIRHVARNMNADAFVADDTAEKWEAAGFYGWDRYADADFYEVATPENFAALCRALRASTASESRLRGALEGLVGAAEKWSSGRLHQVHAAPMFICVCDAEADFDYPSGKPCTCPRPDYKRGCVENCPACAAKKDKDAALSAARAALLPEGTPGDGK